MCRPILAPKIKPPTPGVEVWRRPRRIQGQALRVSLFFARALLVWFYNENGYSVLLVAIFHASFDSAMSQLSYDAVRVEHGEVLDFSAAIVLPAATVIIATRGRLGRARESVDTAVAVSDLDP